MDLLSDILGTLEFSSQLYFRAELTAPFSVLVPEDRHVIRFHVASEGSCWIKVATSEPTRFGAGDLVLVPHGAAHILSDVPDSRPVPLPDVLSRSGFDGAGPLSFGGGGPKTILVCGCFGFAPQIMHPVIKTLPPLIHLDARGGHRFAWLEQLMAYLCSETRTRLEAWREIAQRLSEILFIHVLREYSGRTPHAVGALASLADPQIGAALRAIHGEPNREWSVNRLASLAAMSRTVFMERFHQLLGVTPARYVALWRMHKARALLDRTDSGIAEIA
jgi:AraC-like DNA-binding protein